MNSGVFWFELHRHKPGYTESCLRVCGLDDDDDGLVFQQQRRGVWSAWWLSSLLTMLCVYVCLCTCASCRCCLLFLTYIVNFDDICKRHYRYFSTHTATNRELDVDQRSTIDNGWADINCVVSDSSRRLTAVPSTFQRNNIVCTALCHVRMLLPCNDDAWRARNHSLLYL